MSAPLPSRRRPTQARGSSRKEARPSASPPEKVPASPPPSRYIRWFGDITIDDVPLVGGKNASLGEMFRELTPKGIQVPPGFAITADGYRHFLEDSGLDQEIRDILHGLNTGDLSNLRERGRVPLPDVGAAGDGGLGPGRERAGRREGGRPRGRDRGRLHPRCRRARRGAAPALRRPGDGDHAVTSTLEATRPVKEILDSVLGGERLEIAA